MIKQKKIFLKNNYSTKKYPFFNKENLLHIDEPVYAKTHQNFYTPQHHHNNPFEPIKITAWETNQVLKEIKNYAPPRTCQNQQGIVSRLYPKNRKESQQSIQHEKKIKMLKKQVEYLQFEDNNEEQNFQVRQKKKRPSHRFPTNQDLLMSQRQESNQYTLNNKISSMTITYHNKIKLKTNKFYRKTNQSLILQSNESKSDKKVSLSIISRPLTSKVTTLTRYDPNLEAISNSKFLTFQPIHKGTNIPYAFRHSSINQKKKILSGQSAVGMLFIKKYNHMIKGRKLCGNRTSSHLEQMLKKKYPEVF